MELDTQKINTALREAISKAESRYDSPAILIVAHPGVKELLCVHMGVSKNARNVRINGYRIFESKKASLCVLVCAEDYARPVVERLREIR